MLFQLFRDKRNGEVICEDCRPDDDTVVVVLDPQQFHGPFEDLRCARCGKSAGTEGHS